MLVSLIAAISDNGVIGINNELPWRISNDLKFFKSVTLGKPVIMGRKTFESLKRPLPGRPNIVITRSRDYENKGIHVVHDLQSALSLAKELVDAAGGDEAVVIGGAEIYLSAIEFVSRMYLTMVHHSFDGDAFFPEIDYENWELVSEQRQDQDAESKYDYSFKVFSRVVKER